MAQFDLTADAWTEVIASGGSSDQMIVLGMGEALISLGVPGAATSAIKMGGAARASLLDGRIFIAPAGTAVWMRPVGGRVIFSTGATAGGAPTPTPTPAPTKELIYTNLQRIGTVSVAGAAGRMWRQRSTHLTGFRASYIKIGIPMWRFTAGDVKAVNAITVSQMAVEVAGVVALVTFSGNRNKVCDPTSSHIFWSDPIAPPSPLSEWPADAQIYLKSKGLLPEGSWLPGGAYTKGQAQSSYLYSAANDVGDVDAPGAFPTVPVGGVNPPGNDGLCFFIVALPRLAGVKAAMVVGDSISSGASDTGFTSSGLQNKYGNGYHDRATVDGSNQNVLPLIHCSDSGTRMNQWMNPSTRHQYSETMFNYVNIVHDQYGTNDLTADVTLATMKTDKAAFWAICRSHGVQQILTTDILPRVENGGDFTTDAGQTVKARFGLGQDRDLFNAWIGTQVGTPTGPDVLIDESVTVRSPTDPNKWAGNVADGTHPNSTGMGKLAVPLRTAWLATTVDGISSSTPTITELTSPSIAGNPTVGSTLTAVAGTYSQTGTTTARQWMRNGDPIVGSTGGTYVLTSDDLSQIITFTDTVSKVGFISAVSASLGVGPIVTATTPVNTAIPTISGTAAEGQTLTATTGTWTNSPTSYTYQWQRDGLDIAGSINQTRALTSADIGFQINVTVIGANADGPGAKAISASVGPVVAASTPVPVNTVAPVISGTAAVGSTLTTTNGTWTNSPTSYTYQWRQGGVNISGATASTYLVAGADAGTDITCRVTAINAGGGGGAISNTISIPASAGGAVIVNDTLTPAVAAEPLNSHVAESGHTWAAYASGTSGSGLLRLGTNRLYVTTANPASSLSSYVPPSADYDLVGVIRKDTTTNNLEACLLARADASALSAYQGSYSNGTGNFNIRRFDAGTLTTLTSVAAGSFPIGTEKKMTLRLRGTSIKLLVDDVEVLSVTDSTYTAAGRIGIRGAGATQADVTGVNFTTFQFITA